MPKSYGRSAKGIFRRRWRQPPSRVRPWIGTKATANPISVTPTTGTLVLTGYAPTVATPRLVTPGTGTLTLTGYAPTVSTPRLVTPTTGTLTLTGYAPTVSTPRVVTPTTGTLVLTGYAPTVSTPVVVTPTTGTLTLTGYAPTVATPVVVTPDTGSLVLTGYAPTVTVATPGASVEVTPDTGTLVLTGYAPEVLVQTPIRVYGVPHLRPRKRPEVVDVEGVGLVAVIVDAPLVGEKALSRTVDIVPVFDARLIRNMFWGIEVATEAVAVAEFQATAAMPFEAESWARLIRINVMDPAPLPVMSMLQATPSSEMRLRSKTGMRCNGIAACAGERRAKAHLVSRSTGAGVAMREYRTLGRLPVMVGAEAAAIAQENEEQIVLLLLGLPNAHGSLKG